MSNRSSIAFAILCGGFIAGSVDILIAAWIGWLNPIIILHAIASGALGRASFFDGAASAVLGVVLQWAMSLIIAAIYVIASRRVSLLIRYWPVCGIAYGTIIFFVMNYLVVPLSAAPFGGPPFTLRKFGLNMLAMWVFGLIVAFFTHLFTAPRSKCEKPHNPI